MRPVHLVIAAVVSCIAGLHCSGGTEVDTVQLPPAPAPEVEQVSDPAPPPRVDTPTGDRRDTIYGVRDGMIVTSTLRTDDGAFYTAGTFIGTIHLSGVTLVSKGDTDVFIEKQNPDGTTAWVRGVGSSGAESAPHVKSVKDGNVTLLGMTNGRLDCGNGPLPQWDAETFFMCLFGNDDGTNVGGGTFPTGAP